MAKNSDETKTKSISDNSSHLTNGSNSDKLTNSMTSSISTAAKGVNAGSNFNLVEEKNDFDDTELDSDVESCDEAEDADKLEEEIMNMPALKDVLPALNSMKGERRLMVNPLSLQDFSNPKFQDIIKKDTCEEVKIHFVRPKDRPFDWSGFLIMNFASTVAADEALTILKGLDMGLDVRKRAQESEITHTISSWAKAETGSKLWTDRMLYIKNVAPSVNTKQLLEVFSTADDVMIVPGHSATEPGTREIFSIYRTPELMHAAAREYSEKIPELEGHQLKVFRYHPPVKKPLRGYLELKERRVVLKYMEKLNASIEGGKNDKTLAVPKWCEKRLSQCQGIIELDDKARSVAGLSAPSLDKIREIPGVKVIRGAKRRELLMRLGVIDRPRYSNANKVPTNHSSSISGSSGNKVPTNSSITGRIIRDINTNCSNRNTLPANGATADKFGRSISSNFSSSREHLVPANNNTFDDELIISRDRNSNIYSNSTHIIPVNGGNYASEDEFVFDRASYSNSGSNNTLIMPTNQINCSSEEDFIVYRAVNRNGTTYMVPANNGNVMFEDGYVIGRATNNNSHLSSCGSSTSSGSNEELNLRKRRFDVKEVPNYSKKGCLLGVGPQSTQTPLTLITRAKSPVVPLLGSHPWSSRPNFSASRTAGVAVHSPSSPGGPSILQLDSNGAYRNSLNGKPVALLPISRPMSNHMTIQRNQNFSRSSRY